ncbi:MAG: hypothetical protein JW750_04400 [Anaerolineaceae bacterium]|nr:hypothetical protein [Anaerolineaceae bacterium]
MKIVKMIIKILPTFLLSLFLAMVVWASAVTSADPNEDRTFPQSIPIEVVGLEEGLVLYEAKSESAIITLSAPNSVWTQLLQNPDLIRASVDMSGLDVGSYNLTVDVTVAASPVRVINVVPRSLVYEIDVYLERRMAISLNTTGSPAVGFEADRATMSVTEVLISGASKNVERVARVSADFDLTGVDQTFVRTLPLKAYDEDGKVVSGLTLEPAEVTVTQPVTQMGGFRNLVVKVATKGQIAEGYRLTNISAYPAVVTVFSSDVGLVDNLPGYVETVPLDVNGAKDDLEVLLDLNLPTGVSVVGDSQVQVQVGIAAIESSLTLNKMKVELIGVDDNLVATVSPDVVDVILSGPLPVLQNLRQSDVRVYIDMSGDAEGVYQRVPQVDITSSELRVESVLPESIEIILVDRSKVTATPVIDTPVVVIPTEEMDATMTPTPEE